MTPISIDDQVEHSNRERSLLRIAFLFLLITTVAITIAPAVRVGSLHIEEMTWSHWAILPVWIAAFWLLRRVLHHQLPSRDPFLLPIAALLVGWGILMIWRIFPTFGARQTGWLAVATLIILVLLRLPHDLQWLRRYRYLWLIGGLMLMSFTLFLGTNPSGGDPRLWLGCCGFYVQPSEPLRLLLIVFLAAYFAERLAISWADRRPRLIPTLTPLLVVWGISVGLLFFQRDLGTGMLFLSLLAVLLYLASSRKEVLIAAAFFGVSGVLVGYASIGIVRRRIDTWLNPWADPIGDSYQVVQSLIATASGGVFGSGPGAGSPGFVPVAHTDFIFTAALEEWGLIGGLAIISLLAILVGRGLKIALNQKDPFHVFLAAGLSVSLALQSFLILGGVIRLLPLTGVTLPFVSYGGSSLVTSFIALGLLLLISDHQPEKSTFGNPLRNIYLGISVGWLMLAIAIGWWVIYRGPALIQRTDNPRRSVSARYSPRGRILDRQGVVLAETIGRRGDFRRGYPAEQMAMVTGYNSDRFGRSGIELSMDEYLRGDSGTDSTLRNLSYLLAGDPPHGLDVMLTVDWDRQVAAQEALQGEIGAVVHLDAVTGEILALASSPAFNPATLDENWPDLAFDENAPLLNRATQGRYQPGPIMSLFTLAWGHRMGELNPAQPSSAAEASVVFEGNVLTCAMDPGSDATLGRAVSAGCPGALEGIQFLMNGSDFQQMVEAFGLSAQPQLRLETGLDTIDLESGAIDLFEEAIGQGEIILSPLQASRAFAAIVNGGELPALQIVKSVAGSALEIVPFSELGLRHPVLTQDLSDILSSELRLPDSNHIELAAVAVGGGEPERILWYLAAIERENTQEVVVVALEDATVERVIQVGRGLLADE